MVVHAESMSASISFVNSEYPHDCREGSTSTSTSSKYSKSLSTAMSVATLSIVPALTNSSSDAPTTLPSVPNHHDNLLPLWIILGVVLGGLTFALIVHVLLRKHKKTIISRPQPIIDQEFTPTQAMEPSELLFVGGHKFNGIRYQQALSDTRVLSPEEEQRGRLQLGEEQKQDIRHDGITRTNTNRAGDDGRRNGVFFTNTVQNPMVSQDKVKPETSQSGVQHERTGPLRRRSALEAWKKGVVPPQKRGSISQMATETSQGSPTLRSTTERQ